MTQAVTRASEMMGLAPAELAKTLGLSRASISRMQHGRYLLSEESKSWELGALHVRLFRSLDAITAGDEQSLRAWMRNNNTDLHAVPAEYIQSVSGLAETVSYVDSYRARV
ncbi:antitoxin Xre/MbcA/ParS toxin-binding domain-containing protein [Thiohalobacter sp. COW1]|uniref:antitoxin Xre/MbcA/ParS toxin-binding domain-containing protein n=1 Tax=Thiohalobacter sp. COW1 TaxID=2795687 RepID=UPI001916438A|nr:antitoxin Xre/MbcA/ParS toxin-binding domain-containing protein [Thiohalobacter sp. COW1]